MRGVVLAVALALAPVGAVAQDGGTLADIRQELSVLAVELQRLKGELNTTGGVGTTLVGTSVLSRVDAIEAQLQRLTARTEELQFRIDRVVTDGTNRIGDLEFRICEIEPGCDIGSLGPTASLGGSEGAAPAPALAPAPPGGTELAVGEAEDFDRAKEALDSGSFRSAVDLFAAFAETYTGGPLTAEAHYWRGTALDKLDETAQAARAYLAAFSGDPDGTKAPDALLALGLSLDKLGQRADACIALGEVSVRYPSSTASTAAQSARAGMSCS